MIQRIAPTDVRHPITLRTLVGALAAMTLLACPTWAERDVDQTVAAGEDGIVEIDVIAGSVAVEGWSKAEVRVTGTVGDGIEVEVERRGGRVYVDADPTGRSGNRDEAHLVVRVPRGSEVRAETVSADLRLDDVQGRLELSTVSGDLEVEADAETFDFETVSGDIDVVGGTETARIETVNGSVDFEGAAASLRVNAVSGSIEIELEAAGEVEAETVSGDIEISGSGLDAHERIDARSHSGDLRLTLPDGVSTRIDIETHSGAIRNAIGPEPERPRYGPGRWLKFTLGDGDGRVRLQTFSGSVVLR